MMGLEPTTSGVTGRCSNQLSYIPKAYGISSYVKSPGPFDSIGLMTSLPEYYRFSAEVCQCFDCNRSEREVQGIGQVEKTGESLVDDLEVSKCRP